MVFSSMSAVCNNLLTADMPLSASGVLFEGLFTWQTGKDAIAQERDVLLKIYFTQELHSFYLRFTFLLIWIQLKENVG